MTFRSVLFGLSSAAWIALTMLGSLGNLAFSPGGQTEEMTAVTVLGLLAALAVPFALIWRKRAPEVVLITAVVIALVLPIGATVSWVALGSLFRWRQGSRIWADWWLWAGTVAVTAATYVAVRRDLSVPNADGSILGIVFASDVEGPWRHLLPSYAASFTTAILMALVLGAAVLARFQTNLKSTSTAMSRQYDTNLVLNNELARYEERERIARELHDSLGNKFATMSMISGAMRVAADHPDTVHEQAELLQHTAMEATAEMHEIIQTYRGQSAPPTPLEDLDTMIARARRAGMAIDAVVAIADAENAPTSVSRAAYRVVQEITTNAAKHAPRALLTLSVTGGPGGIHIQASNPLHAHHPETFHQGRGHPGASVPTTPAPLSGGTGLVGAGERVEQLGGWLQGEPQAGYFNVTAYVPWRTDHRSIGPVAAPATAPAQASAPAPHHYYAAPPHPSFGPYPGHPSAGPQEPGSQEPGHYAPPWPSAR